MSFNVIIPGTRFYPAVGVQESLTDDAILSPDIYHTKIYSKDKPCNMTLPAGTHDGQMKCITMTFRGTVSAEISVTPSSLLNGNSVKFVNPGDQVILQWMSGYWCVIYSINLTNPQGGALIV